MKTIPYLSLAAACLACASSAYSSDKDLIDLVQEARQAAAIMTHLESDAESHRISEGHRRALKPISAFGGVFEGEVSFKDGIQDELLLWTQESSLSPQAALNMFDKMAGSLKEKLGPGRVVSSIPNYGDAADVKSTAVLWRIRDDIILLRLDQYPSRGGIELVRRTGISWRNNMGADESEFWVQTLDLKTGAEPSPEAQEQNTPKKTGVDSSIAARFAPKSNPKGGASSANEKSTLSTPWGILALLVFAGTGLLWVLQKRRK